MKLNKWELCVSQEEHFLSLGLGTGKCTENERACSVPCSVLVTVSKLGKRKGAEGWSCQLWPGGS